MKLVYGVGINDCRGWATRENKPKDDLHLRVYSLWIRILTHGYSKNFELTHPSYKDVTVCERWHRLSNFAEDIKSIPNYELWRDNPLQRICLDKDIRIKGNREYSPAGCMFVTASESGKDANTRNKDCYVYSKEFLEKLAKNNCKPVICTYPNGSERRFSSIKDAVIEGGFTRANIYKCCIGKRKTHKNCKFRYA